MGPERAGLSRVRSRQELNQMAVEFRLVQSPIVTEVGEPLPPSIERVDEPPHRLIAEHVSL
jgi:hypothetical protein